MRPLLSVKTLLRTPFKTLLTFLLLAAVTFALFSRVAEYSITNREIKNAAKQYRGVGTAEITPAEESLPESSYYIYADSRMLHNVSQEAREYYLNKLRYQPLSQKQISSILELPYITSSSKRYMTPGVSGKYHRLDEGEDYYNYTARFIIEGTLAEVNYDVAYSGDIFNKLTLNGCTILAGNPSWLSENKKIIITAYPKKFKKNTGGAIGAARRIAIEFDHSYNYDTEYVRNLTVGNRYVFVGRLEPLAEPIPFYLSDLLTNPWCEAIQSIEGEPENYLETNQFAPLRELIELTNSDLRTFDVVYTDDMSSIMRFAENKMAVIIGRRLTKVDSVSQSNVCVVSRDFASKNNLKIGDKIALKLGTEFFEQYKGLGAVAASRERYSPAEKPVNLEIIGMYADIDGKKVQLKRPHWGYSINTIFVPKSLLPLDESKLDDHIFSPSEFSFTVDDAWNIPAFLEKAAPEFKKMGLTLIFDDDGWPEIADNFKLSAKLSVIAILVLSGAVIAATGFIIFLFIGRKKKEYAIMRALGTTRKESAKALILPLMAISVLAVFAGSFAAWIYTMNTVARTNDALSKIEEYTVNTTLPVTAAIGCIMGEILLLLFFALFGLWRVGAIPPLMLLQDNQSKQARNRKLSHNSKNQTYNKKTQTNNKKNQTYNKKTQMQGNNSKPTDAKTNACAESAALTGMLGSKDPDSSIKSLYSKRPSLPALDAPIPDTAIYDATGLKQRLNFLNACRHVLRYVSRHIYRSAAKSILAILMSALLIGAVGQFAVMRNSYVNLCSNMEIKPKFLNGLHLITLKQIEETGYVKNNPYYEYTHYTEVNSTNTSWVLTNDIERYTGEETEVTYAEGYDESCMKELGNVCVAGSKLLNEYGLKPGDRIHVTMSGALGIVKTFYINKYRREHPKETITDEKILEKYNDQILNMFTNEGAIYTVVGSVTTPSGRFDKMFFSPGTLSTKSIFGFDAPLDLAEFTLADNLKAYEFRTYAESIAGGDSNKYLSNRLAFIMDTSKIDNLLNTLKLLGKLFPVVLAAAVLIGGLVCGLIIIQAAREAAILRVLGTKRRRTRAILVIEQVVLCIAGLVAGVCGLLLYNGPVFTAIAPKLYLFVILYFAGCLMGAVICSVITTHRKVLELLQTKE